MGKKFFSNLGRRKRREQIVILSFSLNASIIYETYLSSSLSIKMACLWIKEFNDLFWKNGHLPPQHRILISLYTESSWKISYIVGYWIMNSDIPMYLSKLQPFFRRHVHLKDLVLFTAWPCLETLSQQLMQLSCAVYWILNSDISICLLDLVSKLFLNN